MQLLPDDGRNIGIPVEHSATLDVIREDLMKPEDLALYRQRKELFNRCRVSSREILDALQDDAPQ